MLVLPEGYLLGMKGWKSEYYEPWISEVGTRPCVQNSGASPMQAGIAAMASEHKLAIVANIFVSLPDGQRLINDVVFDSTGTVLATYTKHVLFITERGVFSRGPFQPVTFDLLGHRFGLVICFEGVYPYLTRDFSQLDALKQQGASVFVWSVGGMVPLQFASSRLARRYLVSVLASEGTAVGATIGEDGKPLPSQKDVPLSLPGYHGHAALRLARLPPRALSSTAGT